MKANSPYIFSILLILSLSSCTNKMSLDENSVPKTLLIGMYVGEGPELTINRIEPIRKYLESKLSMPVELFEATDYTAVIEALRAKKVHMAYLSPFAYVLAAEKTDIDVMVTVGVNGKPHNYQSMIITGKNSGIKSMEDVVARSHELTLSFADPASASGHLIPRAYLKTLGLDAKSSFKETIFTNGHIASAMAVKAGKVDLGCTVVILNNLLQERGMLKPDDLVVLWISDPIVTEPIVIRSDVNKQFAEKVKQAYLDLPATVPNVWKAYTNKIYSGDSLTYIVAHDSLYNGIRKLSAGLIDTKVVQ